MNKEVFNAFATEALNSDVLLIHAYCQSSIDKQMNTLKKEGFTEDQLTMIECMMRWAYVSGYKCAGANLFKLATRVSK